MTKSKYDKAYEELIQATKARREAEQRFVQLFREGKIKLPATNSKGDLILPRNASEDEMKEYLKHLWNNG